MDANSTFLIFYLIEELRFFFIMLMFDRYDNAVLDHVIMWRQVYVLYPSALHLLHCFGYICFRFAVCLHANNRSYGRTYTMGMFSSISSQNSESAEKFAVSWWGENCVDGCTCFISSSEWNLCVLYASFTFQLLFISCRLSVFGVSFNFLGFWTFLGCFYLFLEFWLFLWCTLLFWEDLHTHISVTAHSGCAVEDPGVVSCLGDIACPFLMPYLLGKKSWMARTITYSKSCSCLGTVVAESARLYSSTNNL